MPSLLSGRDTYISFRGRKPSLPACPTCQIYLDPWAAPFPGKARPKYDLCVTDEDMMLASPRLKAFIEVTCTSEINWYETGGGYFILRPRRVVILDLAQMGVHYSAQCRGCGRITGLTADLGAVRILQGQPAIGPKDLVRSQQAFGEGNRRRDLLIAGDLLVAEMQRLRMKGTIHVACEVGPADPRFRPDGPNEALRAAVTATLPWTNNPPSLADESSL